MMSKSNTIHPETVNKKIHPETESDRCDQPLLMRFDICLTGHDEASPLLDWLETQLKAHIKPPFTCTRNVSSSSTAYIVALTPNSWSCPSVLNVLATATCAGKRIGLVHLPLNESEYLYSSDVANVGNVSQIRVDLGVLLKTVSNEFSSVFTDCEVMSIRREPWAANAVIKHLIEMIGYGRKYSSQNQLAMHETALNEDVLSDCIFEGIAYDKTNDSLLGWYQIIAQFDNSCETAVFEVEYLSQSHHSLTSFKCANTVQWSPKENKIWQTPDDHVSWYNDERWKLNTDRVMSFCSGFYDPQNQTMLLTNSYYNSRATLVTEIARLQKKQFRYHMCVLGVQTEIAETASMFANIMHSRAQQSRKPRIMVLCDKVLIEKEISSHFSIVRRSGILIVFVTSATWQDTFILQSLDIAQAAGIQIILISQSDPRLQGHCIVPDIMKDAPAFVQSMDVLPFYRRSYEQNAFLDHIFTISSFTEAIIDDASLESYAHLGSSDPAVIDNKLFARIDLWTDTSELKLLQSGNWRYYEGKAGRGGHIWGWYQIDCLFHDDCGEMVMRVHYQSLDPGSVPSYLTISDFDWNPTDSSFAEANGGSWHGTRNTTDFNLVITNKFGDTIIHTAMPFVHHFFLSHIQREATDMCAFVASELRNVTKIGAKTRCWFDQKASEINKEGMYAGIVHSGAYVLFLTPSVFCSSYVLFELQSAKDLGKPIILLYNTDRESMGYVDIHELMAQAPKEHANLLTESQACLEYASEGEACVAFMYRLLAAGGYVDNMEEDGKVLGQALCSVSE